ncbi:DUF937 domain-containing protein [Lautropia mirabilis]|uniref:DUF937 domain-containing protein n=1 Tax=Lautropia mirabilis TaxID=47671 RepID=UPI0028D513BA|nr:DUF937 domain-containing protein [Lautropia mirabilis]
MSDQSLSQQLFSQLQGEPMQKIAQQLGTSTEQASSAVSQALPLMMGALGNQAQQGGQGAAGIASMLGALGGGQGGSQAGGLGDILGGLLGGSGNAAGGGLAGALGGLVGSVLGGGQSATGSASAGNAGDLLATVFGNQGSARAAEGLGQSTGLGTQGAGNLLGMLLPIVMSFLSQRFLQGGNGTQQLDQALANERQQLNNQGAGGALASLLDQNGDGKLDMNDLVKLGSSLLGGKR